MNKNICFLSDITPGRSAVVSSLDIHNSMRRRLQDIGLIEGTKIKCVLKSPYGDPIAYQIRGAVFALRKDDAYKIYVKTI